MRYVSVDELRSLVGRSEQCMSVYTPLSGNYKQDVSTLQNMLDDASKRSRETFPNVAGHFESLSASQILDSKTAEMTWEGIAVFKSVTEARFHSVESPPEPQVVISDSFHLRPLLSKLHMDSGYIAIRLERERVQVFRGAYDNVTMIRQFFAPRRPRLPDDAPGTPTGQGGISRFSNAAQRIAQMQLDRSTLRFYRSVDKEIRRSLIRDSLPVVLVGDDRLITLFKTVNRHRVPVMGNVLAVGGIMPSTNEMHLKALELLDDIYRRQALRGVTEYRHTKPIGRAIHDLTRIAQAAAQGNIKSLLLRTGTRIWGRVSRKTGRVYIDTTGTNQLADDVLDDISELVLKHNGQVFSLKPNEMPTSEPAAAVLVSRVAV